MLTSPMQGSVNAAEEWAERVQERRDEDGACEGLADLWVRLGRYAPLLTQLWAAMMELLSKRRTGSWENAGMGSQVEMKGGSSRLI